jgi:hypothetical protein
VFVFLAGCGAAAPASVPATATATVRSLPSGAAGDLPPAIPTAGELTDRGQTGALARVALGARRARVAEVYLRYLQALAAQDVAALRALLDDPLVDPDGVETRSREEVIQLHQNFVLRHDLAQLASTLGGIRPAVRSVGDLRRAGRAPPRAMRPDDWLIEGPARGAVGASLPGSLPRTVLVRWIGDEPKIAGLGLSRRVMP